MILDFTEKHFSNILVRHVRKETPTLIIAGNNNDVAVTQQNLRESWIDLPFNMSTGFTETILKGDIKGFVKNQYNPQNPYPL
jgi:hypothetical protein